MRFTPATAYHCLPAVLILLLAGGCGEKPWGVDVLGCGPTGRRRLFESIVDDVPPQNSVAHANEFGPEAVIETAPYSFFLGLAEKEKLDDLYDRREKNLRIEDFIKTPAAFRGRILGDKYALAKFTGTYYPPKESPQYREGKVVAEFIIGFLENGDKPVVCLLRCPVDSWNDPVLAPFIPRDESGKPLKSFKGLYKFRYVRFAARFMKVLLRGSPENDLRSPGKKRYEPLPLFIGPPPEARSIWGDEWRDLKLEIENSDYSDFVWPVGAYANPSNAPKIRCRTVLHVLPYPEKPRGILFIHNGLKVSLKTTLANLPRFLSKEQVGVVIIVHPPVKLETVRSAVAATVSELQDGVEPGPVYIRLAPEKKTAEKNK